MIRISTPSTRRSPRQTPTRPTSSDPRTLVICIGNSSLLGGAYRGARLTSSFRVPLTGLFRISRHAPKQIERAVICSVVPALTPDVIRFVQRTWGVEPRLLTFDAPHGLTLGYRQPGELGADRIAAALGARILFPRDHVVVVDCGTATTVTAVRQDDTLLGGAILPGLAMWPEILALRTAQLPRIEVRRPRAALARTTADGIASGVFFGHVGAIRETVARVRAEAFGRARCVIVGTGGNASRFGKEKLFIALEPTLILEGLHAFAERAFDSILSRDNSN